MLTHCDRYPVL